MAGRERDGGGRVILKGSPTWTDRRLEVVIVLMADC